MKKPLAVFLVSFFVFIVPVFAQTIDRSQYRAIDPFDYRLDEDMAARGAVRRFSSVVRFESQERVGRNTILTFTSLDRDTTLDAQISGQEPGLSPGQVATIYFTATKRVNDTRVLDYHDPAITTESGIGVVKSSIPRSSGINRSEYEEIDPFDYMSDVIFIEEGEIRKYRSTLLFSSKDGTTFFFSSSDAEQTTRLRMRVQRRFPLFTEGQRVTAYFTASKGFLDSLVLDDIEL